MENSPFLQRYRSIPPNLIVFHTKLPFVSSGLLWLWWNIILIEISFLIKRWAFSSLYSWRMYVTERVGLKRWEFSPPCTWKMCPIERVDLVSGALYPSKGQCTLLLPLTVLAPVHRTFPGWLLLETHTYGNTDFVCLWRKSTRRPYSSVLERRKDGVTSWFC